MPRSTIDPPTGDDDDDDNDELNTIDIPDGGGDSNVLAVNENVGTNETSLHTSDVIQQQKHDKHEYEQEQHQPAHQHSLTQKHPRVGVGVVIVSRTTQNTDDNTDHDSGGATNVDSVSIWVGKRKGSHGATKLALPGGHLEMNESWSECALREVNEEMGISLSHVDFLHVTNDIMVDDGNHYVTIFMIGKYDINDNDKNVLLPKNMEPNKCEGWELHTIEQLKNMIDTDTLFLPLENLLREVDPMKFNTICYN